DLDLFEETLFDSGVASVLVDQHLDGEGAVQGRVAAAEDDAHAAVADLTEQAVTADLIGRETRWAVLRSPGGGCGGDFRSGAYVRAGAAGGGDIGGAVGVHRRRDAVGFGHERTPEPCQHGR